MATADRSDVLPRSSVPEGAFDGPDEIQKDVTGARRSLLAHLLIDGLEQTRVVIDRRELGRLFERRRDDIAWEVFSPQLRVCDFLEDVIEYVEAETAEADARLRGAGSGSRCTWWFTTPGADFDVVLQTLQRARGYHFVSLAFGPWPYGPTVYVLEAAVRPHDLGLSRGLLYGRPTMTEEKAFRVLTSCRIDLPVPPGGDGTTEEVSDLVDSTMRELRSELGIAVGLLKELQTIARAELEAPGSSVRWGPVDLEATNALDSLSTAPAFPKGTEQERTPRAGSRELVTEVAASVERAVDLAQDLEDKLACLDAAVHVSRLQRALL